MDLGDTHPELGARLADIPWLGRQSGGGRALVPGSAARARCQGAGGSGQAGTAIDFETLLEPLLGDGSLAYRFVTGDALAFVIDEEYDLLFDHTFLCAVHPGDRTRFGGLAGRLVRSVARCARLSFRPIGSSSREARPGA